MIRYFWVQLRPPKLLDFWITTLSLFSLSMQTPRSIIFMIFPY